MIGLCQFNWEYTIRNGLGTHNSYLYGWFSNNGCSLKYFNSNFSFKFSNDFFNFSFHDNNYKGLFSPLTPVLKMFIL